MLASVCSCVREFMCVRTCVSARIFCVRCACDPELCVGVCACRFVCMRAYTSTCVHSCVFDELVKSN